MYRGAGRKELITNMTNFKDIENPFGDYSLTLQTLKKERHKAWKLRKAEQSLKLKNQIADMEKKLSVYRVYKEEMGITLSKKERENVLKHYDSASVELLMGRKMFTMRQTEAAVRIQAWWRMVKIFKWMKLIKTVRRLAALKI